MAAKDLIFSGIGQSTSPAIKYLLTHGLDIGAVADAWTAVAAATTSWSASAATTTDWTESTAGTTTWTPVSPAS